MVDRISSSEAVPEGSGSGLSLLAELRWKSLSSRQSRVTLAEGVHPDSNRRW